MKTFLPPSCADNEGLPPSSLTHWRRKLSPLPSPPPCGDFLSSDSPRDDDSLGNDSPSRRRLPPMIEIKGLYKGASSSFIGTAFESSLMFGMYSQTKKIVQGEEAQGSRPQLQVIIPSAFCGGAMISFILCPTELVKCRMQVQGKKDTMYARYSGPLDCAHKTLQNEGIKGIFRGGLATLLRESIGNAVFFSIYEFSRYWMHMQLNSMSFPHSKHSKLLTDAGIGILTGGLAGIAVSVENWHCCYFKYTGELDLVDAMLVLDQHWQGHFLPMLLLLLPGSLLLRCSGLSVLNRIFFQKVC
ncbi:mitochondrial arginine transporter BAC1 isoform X3 [Typha angustifolia]|uniref:mitochondrial arginine transporter BAC1 isoform X3 n=1 Tax=Typha angustifolia TaxID=59011 RepID=UPI003C2E8479